MEETVCSSNPRLSSHIGRRRGQADLGRQFAESLVHATFHEVSAKTGEGIEEVFFDIARQFRAHEPEPSDVRLLPCVCLFVCVCLSVCVCVCVMSVCVCVMSVYLSVSLSVLSAMSVCW